MDMMPKGADIGKWNRSNAKNTIELVLAWGRKGSS
jgi:hypothetical protein